MIKPALMGSDLCAEHRPIRAGKSLLLFPRIPVFGRGLTSACRKRGVLYQRFVNGICHVHIFPAMLSADLTSTAGCGILPSVLRVFGSLDERSPSLKDTNEDFTSPRSGKVATLSLSTDGNFFIFGISVRTRYLYGTRREMGWGCGKLFSGVSMIFAPTAVPPHPMPKPMQQATRQASQPPCTFATNPNAQRFLRGCVYSHWHGNV